MGGWGVLRAWPESQGSEPLCQPQATLRQFSDRTWLRGSMPGGPLRKGPAGPALSDHGEGVGQAVPTQVWAHLALREDIHFYLPNLFFLSEGKTVSRLTASGLYNSQGK